jgi:Protein of unknown function (DUF3592)
MERLGGDLGDQSRQRRGAIQQSRNAATRGTQVGSTKASKELIGTFWRWPATVFGALTLLLTSLIVLVAASSKDANLAPLIWPVVTGWITIRFYKARRLEFDGQSITVHNFWKTRTFAWSDVDDVELGVNQRVYAPTLCLTTGKKRRVFAGMRRSPTDPRKSIGAAGEWVDAMNEARGATLATPSSEQWLDALDAIDPAKKPAAASPKTGKSGLSRADLLRGNNWGRHSIWWRLPTALVLCTIVAGGVTNFINDQFRDASLAAHAKEISARVVDTEHQSDDSGANDYLWVEIPACSCSVRVGTDNLAAHPKGSSVPVLYDRTNPTNVRLLVDANSAKGEWLVDAMLFVGGFFALWIAYVFAAPELWQLSRWMRRKSKLQDTTA